MTLPADEIPSAPVLDGSTGGGNRRPTRVLGAIAVLAVAFSFGRVGTVDADTTTTLQDDLDRAEATQSEQAERIAALESDLDTADQDRDRATSGQDDLRAEVTTLASDLEVAEEAVGSERARADDAEGRIAEVEETALLEARAEATAELESQQAALDTRSTKLDERKAALDTRSTSIDERKAALDDRESELDARSDRLDDRAEDLEDAEAAAAEIEVPRLGASSSGSGDSDSGSSSSGSSSSGSSSSGSSSSGGDCHPAYDPCVRGGPDLNCPDIGMRVSVDHSHGDPHGFDRDGDGVGCESY